MDTTFVILVTVLTFVFMFGTFCALSPEGQRLKRGLLVGGLLVGGAAIRVLVA